MRVRFLVPEMIQTSAVDCGPAALKSLLEGFGIGRLREACQTGLDGTSIDTIEIVAGELGLNAQQVMLPPDYLALDDTVLPAVVVTRLPTGYTHFVVVWRKVGPFFQIMDPASGRRWVRARDFLANVYVHRHTVSAEGWREWASSADAMRVLRRFCCLARCAARRRLSSRWSADLPDAAGERDADHRSAGAPGYRVLLPAGLRRGRSSRPHAQRRTDAFLSPNKNGRGCASAQNKRAGEFRRLFTF